MSYFCVLLNKVLKKKMKQKKQNKKITNEQTKLQYTHILKNTSLLIDFTELFYTSIHSLAA